MEARRADSSYTELGQRSRMVAVITLVQVTVAMGNFAILPLTPFVRADFHLLRTQVDICVSVLFLGAMFVSLPGGWLVDRLGARRVLAIAWKRRAPSPA